MTSWVCVEDRVIELAHSVKKLDIPLVFSGYRLHDTQKRQRLKYLYDRKPRHKAQSLWIKVFLSLRNSAQRQNERQNPDHALS